jgi:hypothetical protein
MTPVMDVPPPKADFGEIAAFSAALLRPSAETRVFQLRLAEHLPKRRSRIQRFSRLVCAPENKAKPGPKVHTGIRWKSGTA